MSLNSIGFLSSMVLYALSAYEICYSLGPSPLVTAKLEGSDTSFVLTSLKGFIRRRTNAQSIVRFASGTGMHFPGGKRFYRQQISFPVDVVFLDKSGTILAVDRHTKGGPTKCKNSAAASLFIVNSGEAAPLQVGQKLTVSAADGTH